MVVVVVLVVVVGGGTPWTNSEHLGRTDSEHLGPSINLNLDTLDNAGAGNEYGSTDEVGALIATTTQPPCTHSR